MDYADKDVLASTGTLLCLDVPEGIDFGMDTYSWKTGPRFKGVKMIPTGTHFVYHSIGDPHGSAFSARVGFWITLVPGQVCGSSNFLVHCVTFNLSGNCKALGQS